ncbi:aminoglycoside phosphotransferase family protein [Deinococcus planocerae]|uniref:aminoglycoside phosphotransferase family protein n=1 Tax=Deinococcus planocerae TaxID=1737569 RepID=UPI000C7F52E0|nr:aminoglycoside phosphotransferase family protein [Deinococcus planocerae]
MTDGERARALLGGPVTFLGSGASCVAYSDGKRVVRLARTGQAARFEVDAAIRRALMQEGVPTPEPLSTGTLPDGRPFGVDTLARGDDSGPSDEGWRDLGRALAALHALPHGGFGLLHDRSGAFVGVAPTPAEGLCSRLQDAWPFGRAELEDHPLVGTAPALAPLLAPRRDDLENVVHGPTALCHTDLHGGQVRWREGRLTALLDFGDASIGPPAWDVASLAFFHGWDSARTTGLPCGREAALFGLLLALHHARRSVTLGRPARMRAAVTFARGCLQRL